MEQAGAVARAANDRAAAALGTGETWNEATEAALAGLPRAGAPPDLALLFVDSHFGGDYAAIVECVRGGTGASHLLGCSGQSVIGPGLEAEDGVAVAVMTLRLPGATLTPLALTENSSVEALLDAAQDRGEMAAWLALADPFSTHADALVGAIERRWPGTPVLGGLASAHDQREGTAVFLDDEVYATGAVLLGLSGAVGFRALVAQGATPIGQAWTITDCERNVIQTVGSRPALDVLRETLGALDPETRERAQRNLLVGLAMDEYRDEHAQGDFLIRNLMGADQESGAIAINAIPRVGQTFQFQYRDAAAADADLQAQLATLKDALAEEEQVVGAMLCACNGRGQGLFGEPHHDAGALAAALGPIPTAGLFCNGEIGPVGGANFVHGFTASIALLTTAAD
ncbi:MAG: FIST C-terminal domain-containing protein [Chloroflexi bacterium]|nr:FIST C-terminal domain-containing protein [Chloroflexota bacterium]